MTKYLLGTAALALAAAVAAAPGTARAQDAGACSGPPANGVHFSYVDNGRQSSLWRPACSAMVLEPSRQVMGADQPDDQHGRT